MCTSNGNTTYSIDNLAGPKHEEGHWQIRTWSFPNRRCTYWCTTDQKSTKQTKRNEAMPISSRSRKSVGRNNQEHPVWLSYLRLALWNLCPRLLCLLSVGSGSSTEYIELGVISRVGTMLWKVVWEFPLQFFFSSKFLTLVDHVWAIFFQFLEQWKMHLWGFHNKKFAENKQQQYEEGWSPVQRKAESTRLHFWPPWGGLLCTRVQKR